MFTPYVLLPMLVAAADLPVGSLVCSLLEPSMDAYVPDEEIRSRNSTEAAATSFEAWQHTYKAKKVSGALSQLFHLKVSPGKGNAGSVNSKIIKQYSIREPRQLFAEICRRTDAKKWIEDGIRAGEKSYMIVKLMTVQDAEITRHELRKQDTETEVTVPVSQVLSSGANFLGIVDPGMGVGWTSIKGKDIAFTAPGEVIWAIGYKRIKFDSFLRKNADCALLDSKIYWKPLAGQRGASADDEEELEVDLEDLDAEVEEELDESLTEQISGENDRFLIPSSVVKEMDG